MEVVRFSDIRIEGCKGVLIDLDDTLYSYETAHAQAIFSCWKAWPDRTDFQSFDLSYRKARAEVTGRLLPQGACRSRLFAFQSMLENLTVKEPYVDALRFEQLYWDTLIDSMSGDPDALSFLRRCAKHSVPICVVTDMTAAIQIRKLARIGATPYIAQLVTSEEIGAEKPDARMFRAALRKLGVAAEEAIMIGDNLQKDCLGAQAIGIRSYLIGLNS